MIAFFRRLLRRRKPTVSDKTWDTSTSRTIAEYGVTHDGRWVSAEDEPELFKPSDEPHSHEGDA